MAGTTPTTNWNPSSDAWGNQTSCTGTLVNTLGQANPYRYLVYRFDSETGLFHAVSRYYDPEIGRFLNADVAIDDSSVIGASLFVYCLNNLINRVDISGYISTSISKLSNTEIKLL
jgi:RHS repeat-associated protein